ncbi:hypothetical protein ACQQ68_12010, partial [Corynebacterium diphtheriae]
RQEPKCVSISSLKPALIEAYNKPLTCSLASSVDIDSSPIKLESSGFSISFSLFSLPLAGSWTHFSCKLR